MNTQTIDTARERYLEVTNNNKQLHKAMELAIEGELFGKASNKLQYASVQRIFTNVIARNDSLDISDELVEHCVAHYMKRYAVSTSDEAIETVTNNCLDSRLAFARLCADYVFDSLVTESYLNHEWY